MRRYRSFYPGKKRGGQGWRAGDGNNRCRRGTAVVELAVCLPLLVVLVMATIEASNLIFLKQALTHASYEAARVASRPAASNGDPVARANAILASRNVQQASVVIAPTDIESLSRGNNIVVTSTASSGVNSIVPFSHFGSQNVSVSMTSVKN